MHREQKIYESKHFLVFIVKKSDIMIFSLNVIQWEGKSLFDNDEMI